MSNSSGQYTPETINHVFANLQPEDVEQFYTSYRQWLQQRQLADLHTQIATLRQQIVENNLLLQQTHPTPIALATLARLQSNGVTDLDLLDRMLERGEAWLDNTMQQLEYCEQFDFIRDDYSIWCEHALEGAYDWIDSLHKVQTAQTANKAPSLEAAGPTSPITPAHTKADETLNEATEEVFLQKLMSEGDVSLLDTALEIALVSPAPQAETLLSLVDQDTAEMQATGPNAVLQAAQPLAKHPVGYHTPGDLLASGDAQQNVPIEEEDIIDNLSFEDTIPTKAIVLPTKLDQVAASTQLNETNAAPSLTTTAPVEHDEMDTTSSALADPTNTSLTSHISIEEPEGPAELLAPMPVENISNAPVPEKILSSMTGSSAFAATSSPPPLSTELTSVADQPELSPRPEKYSSTVIPDTSSSTSMPFEAQLVPAANQPDYAQAEHTLTPIDKVDTVETFVTPHLPLEQVEPAEQRDVEYKGAVAPAPAEETHPSHVSASDNTPLSENAKATTAPAETSPDEVSIPSNTSVLEDATSPLTPATAPTKEISDSLNSLTISEIPLAELSRTRDTEPAAGAAEQFYTANDTPWHWDRPLLAETKNTSLTTPSNQESMPPTHSPSAKSPRKPNVLQILFRIFFSRKPKNTNAK